MASQMRKHSHNGLVTCIQSFNCWLTDKNTTPLPFLPPPNPSLCLIAATQKRLYVESEIFKLNFKGQKEFRGMGRPLQGRSCSVLCCVGKEWGGLCSVCREAVRGFWTEDQCDDKSDVLGLMWCARWFEIRRDWIHRNQYIRYLVYWLIAISAARDTNIIKQLPDLKRLLI